MTEEKIEQGQEQAQAPVVETTNAAVNPLERTIELKIARADIEELTKTRLKGYAKTARMPGFRQGHVPMKRVEAMYGREAFADAVNELVGAAWSKAAQESGLNIASEPRFEETKGDDGHLAFTAKFEIFPEIPTVDFASLGLKRYECKVDDASVDETIDVMRKQRVKFEAADRAAQNEDRVTVNFKGTKDGVEFNGGSAQGHVFVLGAGRMLPEFEDAIKGMKAGEKKTFPLTFPKDYGVKTLEGATVEFEVEVTEVAAPIYPEINGEFAKSLGLEGVDAMRAAIKENLDREVAARVAARDNQEVMGKLSETLTFAVPVAFVERQAEAMYQNVREQFSRQGLKADQVEKLVPRDAIREQAERQVRVSLFSNSIIVKNKLVATTEQIEALANTIASAYEEPAEVAKALLGNQQQRVQLQNRVTEENFVNYVLDQAKAEKAELSFTELMQNRA